MEQAKLDNNGVISLLISAERLKMDAVVEECVQYCYANMEEILLTRNNFGAVNDGLVFRIACKFNHAELEELKDKKDKIKSKLFSKFVERLFRNPYDSSVCFHEDARTLFCCVHCGLLLTNNTRQKIRCIDVQLGIDRYGKLAYLHAPNRSWDVNRYLKQLAHKLKSWRHVYWHLWGLINYLKCTFCKEHFRCCDLDKCFYHTDHEKLHQQQQNPRSETTYHCCQQSLLLFNPLEIRTGCQQRDHCYDSTDEKSLQIYRDLLSYRCLICGPGEHHKTKAKNKKPITKQNSVVPAGSRQKEPSQRKDAHSPHSKSDESAENPSEEEDTFVDDAEDDVLEKRLPFSMDYTKSTQSQKILHWKWNSGNSVRYNQDAQREYEHVKLTGVVEKFLNSKSTIKTLFAGNTNSIKDVGGIYTRLEAEWKSKISPSISLNQRKSSISNLRLHRTRVSNLLSDKRFMSRGEDDHR